MTPIKRITLTGLLIAAGVVLPMAFHMIPYGLAGRALLPMHIPVLLAGLVAGPIAGLVVGLVTPLLSHLFTGMPPAAIVPPMMIELAVYGLSAGLMMRWVRTGRLFADVYISLAVALLLGRMVAGAASALYFDAGNFQMATWVTVYFVTALPGLVLQLLFVPSVVIALEREGVIPPRYR